MIRRLAPGHDFADADLALHEELHLYAKTCTYLEEEVDPAHAARFNDRLVAALAHKSNKTKAAKSAGNSNGAGEGIALVMEPEAESLPPEKRSVFSFLTRIFAAARRKRRRRHETEMSMMSH